MRRISAIFSIPLCLAVLTAYRAQAQAGLPSLGGFGSAHHTQAKLILSADTAKPGQTIWAGVEMKMDPDWHTYWENPGAAGMATKIQWQLPSGITAGNILWPLPEKIPPAEVTTYGYQKETVLLVPLTLAGNLPPGELDLKANVSWLECNPEVCIPANQNVEAKLAIGSETKSSTDAATIEAWKNKVPETTNILAATAAWQNTTNNDVRKLIIGLSAPAKSEADFFPAAYDNLEVEAATRLISNKSERIDLVKSVKKFSGDWPKQISGVIVIGSGNQRQGYAVTLPVSNKAPAIQAASAAPGPAASTPSQPLWKMLVFAFIGGLILNIMPCVLPVIALKILGFVSEARSEPHRVRNLGLVYALGVLVSFLALAGIVIGIKSAGHHAGWGMQFGSPVFIVCLTTLITLVALNLFGVFEVTPGGRVMNAAGQLASKHGAPGAFFNGVLATALATPCTAPILATALGFAFLQNNPGIIALIFLFVGLGLAAPYVLLSCNPALMKFLPKPGPWMEKFKIAMGFPMLATALWLFNLAYDDYGKNVFWLGVFLVALAFAAWIFGEFVQRGRKHKVLATVLALICLAGGYVFALEKELDWRAPVSVATANSTTPSAGEINWQPWSPDAVAQARASGHPVLVDFTADWCITCQVNKKLAVEVPSVEKKLKQVDAVTLVGDYTHFPDAITEELNRFHHAGVPLVLVYPKNPAAQPIVLPQVLTPGIVLNALVRAAD